MIAFCRNVTLSEWVRFSEEVMTKGQQNVNSGRLFRTYVDTLLQEVVFDLRNQYEVTNQAFQRRIEQIKEAKTKLEMQHFEVTLTDKSNEIKGLSHDL